MRYRLAEANRGQHNPTPYNRIALPTVASDDCSRQQARSAKARGCTSGTLTGLSRETIVVLFIGSEFRLLPFGGDCQEALGADGVV